MRGALFLNRVRGLTIASFAVVFLALNGCVQEIERPGAETATPVATAAPELTPTSTSTVPPSQSPTPTATATLAPPQPTPTPTPTATPTPPPTPTATTTPKAPSPPGPTPTPPVGGVISGGLFLQMTNVPRESVVHTSTISISGLTTPDAVVSVNGVLVDVDGEGRFTATVSLEPAPNLIEVVASDFQGNKVSAVLAVIYIP